MLARPTHHLTISAFEKSYHSYQPLGRPRVGMTDLVLIRATISNTDYRTGFAISPANVY
jgi:hypothetical protein